MSTFFRTIQNYIPVILSFITGGLSVVVFRRFYRKGVFASHSSNDKWIVDLFWQTLRIADKELIRDSTHVLPGDDVWKKIYSLIRKSKTFVLFWSSSVLDNANVEREWRYAHSLKRKRFIRIVSWKAEESSLNLLPKELKDVNYVSFELGEKTGSGQAHNWYHLQKRQTIIVILWTMLLVISVMAATYFVSKRVQDYLSKSKKSGAVRPQSGSPKRDLTPPPPPPFDEAPTAARREQVSPKPIFQFQPKITSTPTPHLSSNPIAEITYFRIHLSEDGGSRIDFDPNKLYEAGTEFNLVWGVRNAQSVKITPRVIDVSPDEGEVGIRIAPDKTTTYTLEAIGIDGLHTTQRVMVKVKEKQQQIASPILSPPQIVFQARPLSEQEIIDDQTRNFFSEPAYGNLCYQITNAYRAIIYPHIGEVAVDKPERCVTLQRVTLDKNRSFKLEVIGLNKEKILRETSFDMTTAEPRLISFDVKKISENKTTNEYKLCYQTDSVRYMIIKIMEEDVFFADKVIVRIIPSGNICIQENIQRDRYLRVVYVGVNGDSGFFYDKYALPR
jgi:hypothetical protein